MSTNESGSGGSKCLEMRRLRRVLGSEGKPT
jgi:hypothetical protein